MGDGLLAGGDVDGAQGPRDGGDRLHGRAHAQDLAGGHAALGAARARGCTPDAALPGDHLVVRQRPGGRGQLEAVADLDALDGLDAHEGAGQPAVEASVPVHVRAQARRQAVHDDLDDPAEGVAVLVGLVDPLHHGGGGLGVQAADRVLVERRHDRGVGGLGPHAGRGADPAELDDVGDDADPADLLEEVAGDASERHAGGGLAGRGALEDRAGLVEVVLLHAREVGVAGARAGQRGVAAGLLEVTGVDRVGRHDLLPLRPLGVADVDRHRAALGLPVAHAADDRDLVLLELHPRAPAVAEAPTRQGVGDVVGGDPDMGRQALEDRDQGRAVGLARSEPTQHDVSVSRGHRPARGGHAVMRPTRAGPARTPRSAPTTMNGPKG